MSFTLTPENPSQAMARHMGKLLDQLQKGYSNFAPGETWTPNVNLYETKTHYVVCVDLAGVDKDRIDITVEDHMLKLHGHRVVPLLQPENESDGQRTRVHLMEIDHGSFSREVELPVDVHQDRIEARYHDGLLWVLLPKA